MKIKFEVEYTLSPEQEVFLYNKGLSTDEQILEYVSSLMNFSEADSKLNKGIPVEVIR